MSHDWRRIATDSKGWRRFLETGAHCARCGSRFYGGDPSPDERLVVVSKPGGTGAYMSCEDIVLQKVMGS